MNYLQRSFQISFALHALAVVLLIFMGDRLISSEKILVIDFTLEDTAGAGNAGNRAAVNTQTREPNAQQREIRKKNGCERCGTACRNRSPGCAAGDYRLPGIADGRDADACFSS